MGRKAGRSGKLYSVARGTKLTTGALTISTWYQVATKGDTSALGDAPALSCLRAKSAIRLVAGDSVYPLTLTRCGFVRDVGRQASREKFDVTTQTDATASYIVDEISEASGTIDGVFDTTDSQVRAILAQFQPVVDYNSGGTPTVTSVNSNVMRFMLSRDEEGDPEIWQYMPMVIDSLNDDKPMKDAQLISFNYTLDGAEYPHAIVIRKS